jgi:hypothetical protein
MKNYFLLIALVFLSVGINGQNNIGIGTTTPHPSSILDITSITDGLLIPRMTYAQKNAIGTPATGLMVFQTNASGANQSGLYYYDGALWKRFARSDETGGGGASGWTIAGDDQYSNLTGNVGIGTTNPTSKFHVVGNIYQEGGSYFLNNTSGTLQFRNSNVNTAYVQLSTDDLRLGTNSGNSSGKMVIRMDGTEWIWVNNEGEMGFGTEYPAAKLTIHTGQDADYDPQVGNGYLMLGDLLQNNLMFDNNEILARNQFGPSTLYLQQDGGLLKIGSGTAATGTKVQITDGEGSSLSGNGYMVLGTPTSSNMTVDVNEIQARSNGNAATLYLQRSGGNLDISGHTTISPNSGSGEVLRIDGSNPNIGFYQSGAYKSFISQSGSEFFLGVNGGRMHLDGTQVAIGTVNTTAGVDAYKLTVSGKVICEELKVELYGSWPDYVFTDQYQLKPLHELKSFISTNHHLPNIPKASEVEKNGFEVGDMNKKLLEKVEELTLYIIDLQKQIDELKTVTRDP